jgi:hypothetical protein
MLAKFNWQIGESQPFNQTLEFNNTQLPLNQTLTDLNIIGTTEMGPGSLMLKALSVLTSLLLAGIVNPRESQAFNQTLEFDNAQLPLNQTLTDLNIIGTTEMGPGSLMLKALSVLISLLLAGIVNPSESQAFNQT